MIYEEDIDILIENFKLLNDKYKNYDINKYKNIQNDLKIFIENHLLLIKNLINNLSDIEEIVLNLEQLKKLKDKDKFLYIFNECKDIIENIKNVDFEINNHEKILENSMEQ
jgi:hypothetical protein